ncbi:carboxypeptidase-like regulatory domain-containing protein [Marivirga arenosa]|uniref:Carboxypeptidase-like regulatory domain-containing protein n=1 Tax=Marivirga arenosa TaxID=3059076 RepID=A0AA51N7M6_9BACT|nr:carboxypeptidase-like regulatory domain-containing protein [Marivirga sp. ABR2-2]WMN07737.1 carboxypeptidase-like regulatory domain-containing protein [Marivirga sp. ABR2-2]
MTTNHIVVLVNLNTMVRKAFIILFCLLSCYSTSILAQQISGKVLDENQEPLLGASVYIDGTTIGDISDIKGEFSFEIDKEINAVLIVSFVGYQKVYIENPDTQKPYLIQLEPNVSEMKELVVYNNPYSREEMLQVFRDEFIGDRKLQKTCKIINEEDIRFRYNPQTLTFTALSEKPLKIENHYLGYTINYDLLKFELNFQRFTLNTNFLKSSTYMGTTQFLPMELNKNYRKRRKEAYENSTLHFFRALKANNLKKEGFQIFFKGFQTNITQLLELQNIGVMAEVKVKQKDIKFKPKNLVSSFEVLYKKNDQTSISFYTDNFLIDGYGLYSKFDQIMFSGAMSKKKMAMILPADYEY